jgi:hypothetical protein
MINNSTIFSAQTANGNSTSFKAIGDLNGSAKNYSFLTVYGTFGSATITLQYQAADGNWYTTGDVSITDSCAYFIEISVNVAYRLNLSGVTGSTSISSTVYNVA